MINTMINTIYPVGSIYLSINSTNPGVTFKVGTWVAFGTGRSLVGIDTQQSEFDTVEKTGGAKTHTLQTTEIPAHNHVERMNTATTGATGAGFPAVADASTSGGPADTWVTTGNAGGGLAHNNLQPYIVVYMWKRTA